MSDVELLQDAARAMGLLVMRVEYSLMNNLFMGLQIREDDFPGGYTWNPLARSDQAFEIAAKLRINIEHAKTLSGEPYGVNCWPAGAGQHGVLETDRIRTNYPAAVRRAIVRCAAATVHIEATL